MAKKHKQNCIPLVKKTQTKITMKCYYMPNKMTESKKTNRTKCRSKCGETSISCITNTMT